jgi:hypothetical protein
MMDKAHKLFENPLVGRNFRLYLQQKSVYASNGMKCRHW